MPRRPAPRRSLEPHSQRRLVLELRYAIDVAKKQPSIDTIDRVRSLIDAHPHGTRTIHVQYNLGEARLEWLYENGLLPGPSVQGATQAR